MSTSPKPKREPPQRLPLLGSFHGAPFGVPRPLPRGTLRGAFFFDPGDAVRYQAGVGFDALRCRGAGAGYDALRCPHAGPPFPRGEKKAKANFFSVASRPAPYPQTIVRGKTLKASRVVWPQNEKCERLAILQRLNRRNLPAPPTRTIVRGKRNEATASERLENEQHENRTPQSRR